MAIKPIVVGTDGSDHAARTVEWAAREAVLRSAPLRIVAAAEILPRMSVSPMAAGIGPVAAPLIRERDQALASAARVAAATAPSLLIDTDPVDGPPAQAVTASGSGALMLVVGSHDAGAFPALTLGSVGRYAVVHASCPVVVVRDETPTTRRLVAVGIRSPLDCGAALAFAFEEAHLREADLLAVYASQSRDSAAAKRTAVELDELLDDWRCKYPDVNASSDVVQGHPGEVLADLSSRVGLVVLGRHDPDGRLVPGPARVIQAVVSHAHGPVVTVPPQGS